MYSIPYPKLIASCEFWIPQESNATPPKRRSGSAACGECGRYPNGWLICPSTAPETGRSSGSIQVSPSDTWWSSLSSTSKKFCIHQWHLSAFTRWLQKWQQFNSILSNHCLQKRKGQCFKVYPVSGFSFSNVTIMKMQTFLVKAALRSLYVKPLHP